MKKYYTEPELEIRKYSLSSKESITTSTLIGGGLERDDEANLFEGQ